MKKNLNALEIGEIKKLIPLSMYRQIGITYFDKFTKKDLCNMIRIINLKEVDELANLANVDIVNYNFESIMAFEEIEDQKHFYELLDYQFYIRNRCLKLLNDGNKKMILHMPTGTGKTKTTSHIVSEYINSNKNKKILWLAHEDVLLEQGFNEFTFTWSKLKRKTIRIIKEHKYENFHDAEVIFLSYQKLYKYIEKGIEIKADLIVADECHRTIAETYKNGIFNAFHEATVLIGLTATPGRSLNNEEENVRLSKMYDDLKISFDIDLISKFSDESFKAKKVIDYLIERKILSKPLYKNIGYDSRHEFADSDSESAINKKLASISGRNEIIVKECLYELAKKKKIMLFASTIEHSKILKMMFALNGIETSHVISTMAKREVANEIKKFSDNKTKILIVVDKLTTGFDDPEVNCVYIARNTKSIVLYSQMIGRGLRGEIMGGTKDCVVYFDKTLNIFKDPNEVFEFFDENY